MVRDLYGEHPDRRENRGRRKDDIDMTFAIMVEDDKGGAVFVDAAHYAPMAELHRQVISMTLERERSICWKLARLWRKVWPW